MIRDWAGTLAFYAGKFCLWRSRAWSRRAELMSDVLEWLHTPSTWADIRGHRTEGQR